LEEAIGVEKISVGKTPQIAIGKAKGSLDFVESLEKKSSPRQPRRSLKGLWADLGVQISAEDRAEARRETWGGFPRQDV